MRFTGCEVKGFQTQPQKYMPESPSNLVLDRHGLTGPIDLHNLPWLPFNAYGGFKDSSEPIIRSEILAIAIGDF